MTKEQIAERIRGEIVINKDAAPKDSPAYLGMASVDEFNEISDYLCNEIENLFAKSENVETLAESLIAFVKSGTISKSYIGFAIGSLFSRMAVAESKYRRVEAAIKSMEMMASASGPPK